MASSRLFIHNPQEHLLPENNSHELSQSLSKRDRSAIHDGGPQTISPMSTLSWATEPHKISPISSLPAELLIDIFFMVIARSFWRLRHSTKASLTLSHVCSRWRTIAMQCKTLWDAVGFDSMGVDLALVFAARSGDLPMRLEFLRSKIDEARDVVGWKTPDSREGSEFDYIGVILDEGCTEFELVLTTGADHTTVNSSLASLASRVTDLKVETSIPHNSQALLAALCTGDEKGYLELKKLMVSNVHLSIGGQRGCWHSQLSNTLWPEDLFVSGYIAQCECYSLSCINTSRIKSMAISDSSFECLPSLGLYKEGHWEALESLDLSNVDYASSMKQPAPPQNFLQPKVMANLDKLMCDQCDPKALQYVGRNFLIKNLTYLDYRECEEYRELNLSAFNNVLQPLISGCGKLEFLTLRLFAHQYRAFGMMMTTRSGGAQCPNLKELMFGVVDGYERCVSSNVVPALSRSQNSEHGQSSMLGTAPLTWPSEFDTVCEDINYCDPDAHKGPSLAQILTRRLGMGLPKLESLRVWLTTQGGHVLALREEAEYQTVAVKVEIMIPEFKMFEQVLAVMNLGG